MTAGRPRPPSFPPPAVVFQVPKWSPPAPHGAPVAQTAAMQHSVPSFAPPPRTRCSIAPTPSAAVQPRHVPK
eukprot:4143163-Pyramimonas_sp.AAC.1